MVKCLIVVNLPFKSLVFSSTLSKTNSIIIHNCADKLSLASSLFNKTKLIFCVQAKAMADIGIAGSSTDINGLPQTPHCKLLGIYIRTPQSISTVLKINMSVVVFLFSF